MDKHVKVHVVPAFEVVFVALYFLSEAHMLRDLKLTNRTACLPIKKPSLSLFTSSILSAGRVSRIGRVLLLYLTDFLILVPPTVATLEE